MLMACIVCFFVSFFLRAVSSLKPPFTRANSHHGIGEASAFSSSQIVSSQLNSSPLASLSSSSSSHSRRSEPDIKPTVHFAPLESLESDEHDVMKCLYYNRTQCNATGMGCGDTYQLCHPIDLKKPSLCYALWHNQTDTGVVVEFKGCWFGSRKDCMSDTFDMTQPNNNNHHLKQCVATSGNKHKKLHFCCCDGIICNQDMIHIPSDSKPTSATQIPAQGMFCSVCLLDIYSCMTCGLSFGSILRSSVPLYCHGSAQPPGRCDSRAPCNWPPST